jgi:signal transduction histidine kinase/ActR/RegA family two-component response regulator
MPRLLALLALASLAPLGALIYAALTTGRMRLAALVIALTILVLLLIARYLIARSSRIGDAPNQRRTELQLRNLSLETRVADRTRILSEANNRLLVEIAERERTDAALRQAQKVQSVGQLAGGVAHEFNNLLTIVLGALDLMRLRLPPDHPLQTQLATALAAGQRGARITSQLLAFARRRSLMPVVLDLNTVLADIRELLEGALGAGITIEMTLADPLWPALADRDEIEAAILNIALNARDAMGPSGALRIQTRNANLPRSGSHGEPAGQFVELIIEDDGVGMDAHELAQAVDPFFTTKPPGLGAGLGLSQVHGIAQQLGGDLHIASAKGSGTTVLLFLPRATAEPDAPAPPCRGGTRPATPVLLVDDDEQVRQIAADMLRELGYDVTTAADGAAALAALRSRPASYPFAAMVVDFAMPGLTGLDVIEQARSLAPDTPALLITGYMDLAGTANTPPLQPNQVLRKPFTLRELAHHIEDLTGSRTPERV